VKEVQQCAQVMSDISGDKVAIADLFAGRISLFGPMPLNGPLPTLP
jgi:hypothetical protein